VSVEIRDSATPVEDEVLSAVEGRLGLALPADYRSFLLLHNGGVPFPDWFQVRARAGSPSSHGSKGSLWWFGQRYGNESMREHRGKWHRVSRFFAVCAGGGGDPRHPDFEQAFRDRPTGLPSYLAPIASIQGFGADGRLLLNVSPDDPGRGRVRYLPDVSAPAEGLAPVPVASSFASLLETLGYPGEKPPAWLAFVRGGELDGLRRWLDEDKSRIHLKDDWGWTSLDHAVFEGRWDIVDYLLEKRRATPGKALCGALEDGRFSTARGLLHYGIGPETILPSLARKSAMFWTDLEMVRAFLDAGADPNHIDDVASYGNSPLHYAAQAGELEAVRLLLSCGADPRAENGRGESPRDLASRAGHEGVAQALSEATGARPVGPSFEDEPEVFDPHGVAMTGSPGGLDDDALAALEASLGVRLPGEYRGFLKRYNGGVPQPRVFRLRGNDGSRMKREVKRFLAVGGKPSFGQNIDLQSTRTRLHEWALPRRMLAIASVDDEFDVGLLCLSLSGNDRGCVAYYSPFDSSDSSTLPVAKSLNRFFDLLGKGDGSL
jgi:hypothetical protein